MSVGNNILVQVQTYQLSNLGALYNSNPWIYTANKMFENFQTKIGQLGTTVNFDKPPRFVGTNTLVANFEAAAQRFQPLTVDQEFSVSYEFNVEQFLYNVHDYMERFGKGAVVQIANTIGANVATNAVSHTYRCFGDGNTPINSYQQYAQALANFRDYGDPGYPTCVYVDSVSMPSVIGTGLNQFVQGRNEDIANSWELGRFSEAEFYKTNLLTKHIAGVAGQSGTTLTITAVSSDGTTITFSGAGTNTGELLDGDIITLDPSGAAGLFYLQFTGYFLSSQKVQVRVVGNANSSAGTVVATVFPALVSQVDHPTFNTQNINLALASLVGVTATVANSHKAGLITGGSSLFLAMPRLPDEVPYPTGNEMDERSGVFCRQYYGSLFGQNIRGMVHDVIWGSTLADEYAMRIAYPL